VEVTAAATEEVSERESGGGSGEQDAGDQLLSALDQGGQIAEELREGFAGEPSVGTRCLHEWKGEGRQQDGDAQHQCDGQRRKVSHELVAADGHHAEAPETWGERALRCRLSTARSLADSFLHIESEVRRAKGLLAMVSEQPLSASLKAENAALQAHYIPLRFRVASHFSYRKRTKSL
jgi:hypothetical protein